MNLFDDIVNKRAERQRLERFTAELDALGFPYELLDGGMSEHAVTARFLAELEAARCEGFCPLLVPYEPEFFERLRLASAMLGGSANGADCANGADSPNDTNGANGADGTDGANGADCANGADSADGATGAADALCVVPSADSPAMKLVFTEFSRSFRMTALVRLPSCAPWEAPLRLPFCGASGSPSPNELAEFFRVLYEKSGLLPAALTCGELEFILPPAVGSGDGPALFLCRLPLK